MKTHSFLKTLLLSLMLAMTLPSISAPAKSVNPIASHEEQAARLKNRLEEIKALDTKKLSREKKKELRVEVRAIKKELATIGGGIYLSVGAILLILLLIILLA